MRGRWALSGILDDSSPPAERPPTDLIAPWHVIEPELRTPSWPVDELDELPENWEESDGLDTEEKLNPNSVPRT